MSVRRETNASAPLDIEPRALEIFAERSHQRLRSRLRHVL
jgi:hypothetical protein